MEKTQRFVVYNQELRRGGVNRSRVGCLGKEYFLVGAHVQAVGLQRSGSGWTDLLEGVEGAERGGGELAETETENGHSNGVCSIGKRQLRQASGLEYDLSKDKADVGMRKSRISVVDRANIFKANLRKSTLGSNILRDQDFAPGALARMPLLDFCLSSDFGNDLGSKPSQNEHLTSKNTHAHINFQTNPSFLDGRFENLDRYQEKYRTQEDNFNEHSLSQIDIDKEILGIYSNSNQNSILINNLGSPARRPLNNDILLTVHLSFMKNEKIMEFGATRNDEGPMNCLETQKLSEMGQGAGFWKELREFCARHQEDCRERKIGLFDILEEENDQKPLLMGNKVLERVQFRRKREGLKNIVARVQAERKGEIREVGYHRTALGMALKPVFEEFWHCSFWCTVNYVGHLEKEKKMGSVQGSNFLR